MKPIGPYVAVKELPGAAPPSPSSPVRTLRAMDRLTGMPVLLHVLPYALSLPELPEHPNLLPTIDSGMDGEQAYVVTELPLNAELATDPLLAARGALSALIDLHRRGLTHGGLHPTQLWNVGGLVALSGAGLPWTPAPATPDDDLRDLGRTLQALGHLPEELRPLLDAPGTLTARSALKLLGDPHPQPPAEPRVSPDAAQTPEAPVKEASVPNQTPLPQTSRPQTPRPLTSSAPQSPAPHREAAPADAPAPVTEGPVTEAPVHPEVAASETPDQHASKREQAPVPEVAQPVVVPKTPAAPVPADRPVGRHAARPGRKAKDGDKPQAISQAVPAAPLTSPLPDPAPAAQERPAEADVTQSTPASPAATVPDATPHDGSPILIGEPLESGPDVQAVPPVQAEPSAAEPPPVPAAQDAPQGTARPTVSPFSSAPAGALETPQERRKRQNEERRAQAMLDAKAAAERKAKRLKAEAEARKAQGQDAARPIQIGGSAGLPNNLPDDLPAWTPPAEPQGDAGEAGPRRLQMRDVERLPPSLRRPQESAPPPPEVAEEAPPPAPGDAGHLPSRRMPGEPIRIGWDEDDSWRVVKAVPAPAQPERRPLPQWALPRWLLPLVAALLLAGGAFWAFRNSALSPAASPPTACCTVTFTVTPASGGPVYLMLETAPTGAGLKKNDKLGQAPGDVAFPVKGTYRLRLEAPGYNPTYRNVTVPRTQPVPIKLEN